MNTNFVILIIITSILTIAPYSSCINFVSALETNCYTSGVKWVCVHTDDSVKPPFSAITFCDTDGKNCKTTILDKVDVVTPEVKNSIKNAQTAFLAKSSVNPPQCPNTGPIPPDCTMKPPLK